MQTNTAPSPAKKRLGKTLRRAAVTATIGIGLSLAVISPAEAATATGGVSPHYIQPQINVPNNQGTLILQYPQASKNCGYYHWIKDGALIGDGYKCTDVAGSNTYHAWVKCSDGLIANSRIVSRGNWTAVGCNPMMAEKPVVGGFTRDS